MYLRFFVAFVVLFVVIDAPVHSRASYNESESCREIPRKEIEQYLSLKTPYRAVENLDDKPIEYEGCHPIRMWSLVRHCTRNPITEVIEEIKTKLSALKHHIVTTQDIELCPGHLERLRKWNFTVSVEEENYLVAAGAEEIRKLAERFQKHFSTLLPKNYSSEMYYFKYTDAHRTLKSAESFVTGLFRRDGIGNIVYPEALHRDPVLAFYKLCTRWKTEINKNPQIFVNLRKFLQSEPMLKVINHIRQQIKLSTIDADTVRMMYIVCAFETAWQRPEEETSCQLFDRSDLQALEFAEELKYYWKDGYGYELTQRVACPAVVDMFKNMDPHSTLPNSTFYFTHSGTMLMVLAHLGLYKDDAPLTYKDYGKQRKWRLSAIDAFATNLAFVLYECKDLEPMVLTMHQERVIHIPGCPLDNDLCSLQTMRKLFANSLDNCNFNEMCFK